jgi:hypothetical protein
VEVNRALGGIGGEVWSFGVDAQRHVTGSLPLSSQPWPCRWQAVRHVLCV